jgi:hypothetical protein
VSRYARKPCVGTLSLLRMSGRVSVPHRRHSRQPAYSCCCCLRAAYAAADCNSPGLQYRADDLPSNGERQWRCRLPGCNYIRHDNMSHDDKQLFYKHHRRWPGGCRRWFGGCSRWSRSACAQQRQPCRWPSRVGIRSSYLVQHPCRGYSRGAVRSHVYCAQPKIRQEWQVVHLLVWSEDVKVVREIKSACA